MTEVEKASNFVERFAGSVVDGLADNGVFAVRNHVDEQCVAARHQHHQHRKLHQRVVQDHASEAAFLWSLRQRAVDQPHFKLEHLHKLDCRVTAHLHGLELAADVGWAWTQVLLGRADAGAVFAAAYLAFSSAEPSRMRDVLKIALTEPMLEDGLVAALAWLPAERTAAVLERLCASPIPDHRRIAVCAMTWRRDANTAGPVRQACRSDVPKLRAAGLRAIGQSGQRELVDVTRDGLHDVDPECCFWAAWSLALLEGHVGAEAAWDAARHLPANLDIHHAAIAVAMRCGEPAWAREVIRELAQVTDDPRSALRAAGAFGDPALVPWLLNHCEERCNARIAAESFTTITGADLEYLDLDIAPPEGADEEDEAHPDDNQLRWPNVPAMRAWWHERQINFQLGRRYLCGQPIAVPGIVSALRGAYQRQRHGAAIELMRLQPGTQLFPTTERSDWQLRRLGA